MALPSLNDMVFIIVLLIPGFITLVLFRWLAILERKLSDYQLVIWSVFLSLLIYGIFGCYTGINDFDTIRDNILLPANLVSILGLSLTFGMVLGLITRIAFRRRYVRGDCWAACMKAASKGGSWVIIYTSDGREYKGILHYAAGTEFPKEITIRKPKLILRNSSDWEVIEKEIEIGKEILFSEKDIARVVFYEAV